MQLSSIIARIYCNWLCHSRHRLDGNYIDVDRVDEALEHGPKILISEALSISLGRSRLLTLREGAEFASCVFESYVTLSCIYFVSFCCFYALSYAFMTQCETDNCSDAPSELCKTRSNTLFLSTISFQPRFYGAVVGPESSTYIPL
jgi:hypothetical protein